VCLTPLSAASRPTRARELKPNQLTVEDIALLSRPTRARELKPLKVTFHLDGTGCRAPRGRVN